jgi:hypothetical protein
VLGCFNPDILVFMEGKLVIIIGLVVFLTIFSIVILASLGKSSPNQFCGGITSTSCPAGFTCKYDGNYPDASGVCISVIQPIKDKINGFRYTCPVGEWVDCMPPIGDQKPQCKKDFLDWATKNCPGFKGAAY